MNRYESDDMTGLGWAFVIGVVLAVVIFVCWWAGQTKSDTLVTIALIAAGIVFAWFLLNALAAPMLSSKLSRLEEQRDREQGPRT